MASYLLAYDLTKEENSDDYKPLWAELKRWGGQRTQYSMWLVADNSTAKEVHDHFRQYLDSDDRLWVAELVRNHYFSKAIGGTNKWIADNPRSR